MGVARKSRPKPMRQASGADAAAPPRAASRAGRIGAEPHGLGAIFNLVRAGDAKTRQEIERLSGLGRAVVADRLATLMKLGLASEGELGRASGGRAPRLVQFRAEAAILLVAALDLSTIAVGVSDLTGKLLIEHHEAADLAGGPEMVLKRLSTLFDWVLEQHKGQRDIWGIGIGVPGPVESSTGGRFAAASLHFLPSWGTYPFAEQLALRYRAPISVRNIVQMRTLGELGAEAGASNLLFVDLGKEISSGLLSEGRLHRGVQGAAGMIGHVLTGNGNTAVCRCGNNGCLEVVAGADAIIREALSAARDGRSRHLAEIVATNGTVTVADVGLAAQRGDPFSAELLSRCGRQVGTVLAAVTNAFNPSLIVLGGEVAETGDILLAAIREAVYRHSNPILTRDLRIVRSGMGSSAGLVGSAQDLLNDLFAPDFVGEWIGSGAPLAHPHVAAFLRTAEAVIEGAKRRQTPPAVTNPLVETAV